MSWKILMQHWIYTYKNIHWVKKDTNKSQLSKWEIKDCLIDFYLTESIIPSRGFTAFLLGCIDEIQESWQWNSTVYINIFSLNWQYKKYWKDFGLLTLQFIEGWTTIQLLLWKEAQIKLVRSNKNENSIRSSHCWLFHLRGRSFTSPHSCSEYSNV